MMKVSDNYGEILKSLQKLINTDNAKRVLCKIK